MEELWNLLIKKPSAEDNCDIIRKKIRGIVAPKQSNQDIGRSSKYKKSHVESLGGNSQLTCSIHDSGH